MISKSLFFIFPGCLLAGFAVYTVFSYLLVPLRITLPLSFTMGILIFGLAKYYSSKPTEIESTEHRSITTSQNSVTRIIFVAFFIISLLIVTIFPYDVESGLFTDWQHIEVLQIIKILSAIGICFFLPGYFIVLILEREHRLTAPLKLLLAYSFSILITGLIGYIGASFGYELSDRRMLISSTSVALLALFLVQTLRRSDGGISNSNPDSYYKALLLTWNKIRSKNSQIIVIGSLFLLVILSTYYLNNGKIVVDQWFYHGRAILMNTASYRDLSTAETYIDPYESKISDVNQINPPFFSALLSSFFNLSGSPSVNSYVSINFLNIMPVVAFYYFLASWIHGRNQRAIMLAITLFVLSSGFGWIYALYGVTLTNPITSTGESIDLLSKTTDATYDIGTPTTFLDVGHPDITTPFIIVALPVGFTLLGLLGSIDTIYSNKNKDSKNRNFLFRIGIRHNSVLTTLIIITVITFLGILAHDEFYLFVIIGATLIIFRKPNNKSNISVFYAAFLCSILLVTLIDFFVSPTPYYIQREIFSVPLAVLSFIFVSASWALYSITHLDITSSNIRINIFRKKIRYIIPQRLSKVFGLELKAEHDRQKIKTLLRIATASIIVYLYLFTFFVWTQVSVQDTLYYIKDQWNVPLYLYPMKFGLIGILGLVFVISYIFRKFEKEIFIFGAIAFIAFAAGPFYDEHRFGKYIMATMDVFAALLLYQILSSSFLSAKLKLRPLLTGLLLASVVLGSGLSVLMFAGYVELLSTRPDYLEGGRRDFPTESEFKLLNFLHDKVKDSKIYNIAVPEKEVDVNRGLVTKIYGFTGIPRVKLIQSPLTLNSSTLEGLYTSLVNTDTGYIVLPKGEFVSKDGQQNLPSSPLGNNIIQFAIDSFPMAYQDSGYTVLKVPHISPPSKESSNVGLVYQKDANLLLPDRQFENVTLPFTYSRHHYPLSVLALSNIKYDTFAADDYALFSKENLVLPYDPFPHDGHNLGRYLDYVKSGGKLIVINSDKDNFQGSFAKLLSIELGDQGKFDAILPASQSSSIPLIQKNNLNISGVAQNIIINSTSNDTRIQSYYAYSSNEGKYQNMVAPFSIEKRYGNGKIIFVNAAGYFDAIFKHSSSKKISSNDSYFMSLGKVLALMDLEFGDKYRDKVESYQVTSAPSTRIIGDLKLAADETVLFNSSSLSFPYSDRGNKPYSYDISAGKLSISKSSKISFLNKVSNSTSGLSSNNGSLNYSSSKSHNLNDKALQYKNENVILRNLILYGGPFEVNIISKSNKLPIQLPTSSSHYDYIGILLPNGFDVRIKFPEIQSAYVEFDVTYASHSKHTYEKVRISNIDYNHGINTSDDDYSNNEIYLHAVNSDPESMKYISVLMKSPEMTILKKETYSNDTQTSNVNMAISFNEESHKDNPIEIENDFGKITARFAYVDNYDIHNNTEIRTQFLTYLDKAVKIISDDGKIHFPAELMNSENKVKIQMPGDISEFAKMRGMQSPWIKELSSNTSIALAISVLIITILTSRYLANTRKKSKI